MTSAVIEARLTQMEAALLALDRVAVSQMLVEGAASGSPLSHVENLIAPVLERIGAKWEDGQVSLSQVYMSGRLCEELVDTILPPSDLTRKSVPPMAIATLEDYHLLGLRIV